MSGMASALRGRGRAMRRDVRDRIVDAQRVWSGDTVIVRGPRRTLVTVARSIDRPGVEILLVQDTQGWALLAAPKGGD